MVVKFSKSYLILLSSQVVHSSPKSFDHVYYHYSEPFQVDCLSPLYLVLLGFCLVPPSELYSSVTSFCVNYYFYFYLSDSVGTFLGLGEVALCRRYPRHPSPDPRARGHLIAWWCPTGICGLGLQAVRLYFSCFWCLPPDVKSQLVGKDPDAGKD